MSVVAQKLKRNGWSWPQDPAGPPSLAGRVVGTVLPVMFLGYLVTPINQVFGDPHPGVVRVAVVAIVLLYAAVYLLVAGPSTWPSRTVRVASVIVMTACGISLAALLGPDDLVYMTYAIAAALIQTPPMAGLLLGLATTTALLIGTTVVDGAPDLTSASVLVVLTIALFGTRQVMLANAELRAARDEIATLAVTEERARMARDLHDVLGHSLTTITVKAGLARRILESDGDGADAIAELRDVEHLSRTALSEVRATVSGYRKASLPAEIVGARAALAAAEITADLPHAVDNVPAELQEPFAYVLREGVTNVIRHSGAHRCEVRLGESWIEVRDDGSGAHGNGSGSRTSTGTGAGHGLAGLRERLTAVGGSLDAGTAPEGGFVVRANVPAAVTA